MSSATPASPPLDTRLRVETPEGVDLLLSPAGPLVRSRAFVVDLALRGALALAGFALLGKFGKLGVGFGLILLFLLNWWYMVLFEVLNQGCTPGKRLLGLCVVHEDGTPVGWGASLLRNLLRFVDMLPLGYCCGLLASLASPRFQRLGDLAAGTLVIHRPRKPTPAPKPLLRRDQACAATDNRTARQRCRALKFPGCPRSVPPRVQDPVDTERGACYI